MTVTTAVATAKTLGSKADKCRSALETTKFRTKNTSDSPGKMYNISLLASLASPHGKV